MTLLPYRTRRQPVPQELVGEIVAVLDPEQLRTDVPFRRMAQWPKCLNKQLYVTREVVEQTASFLLDNFDEIVSAEAIECQECRGFHLEIRRG